MQFFNKDTNDFSYEVLVQLGVMLEAIWGGEMIAYKVSRTLDAYGVQGSLFQKRKQALNNARRGLQEVIRQLEIAFDESIDQVFVNEKQLTGQYGAFQKLASDTLQMLLIYHARGEGDQEKRDRMKKALLNFKPESTIDLDAIMKYYDFKL